MRAAEFLSRRTAGPRHRHKDKHRRSHGHRQRLGAAQRQRLGHQFAHHHVKISDESEAQHDRPGGRHMGIDVSVCRGDGQRTEPTRKDARRQWFTDPAQGQRTKSHAELNRGQKVVHVLLQPPHRASSRHSRADHLLDARIADRDQRELGGHKEAVGQNEHGHGDKLKQRKTVHPACEDSIWQ